MNPQGSLTCGEGQASIEWKAGTDGQRTHLVLGFEQNPHIRMTPSADDPEGPSAVEKPPVL